MVTELYWNSLDSANRKKTATSEVSSPLELRGNTVMPFRRSDVRMSKVNGESSIINMAHGLRASEM
eukprot:CAMPEP_0184648622 /NCGR_PEP_ID=MMETSP0308-20130426/5788_1 /TAXON_ID=38269 /ORGANISM="Gloeochaete witrockiana, Strain SAG 46.84" /LENGTH=65 /DNA_ID=CAMNT_0027080613 /DNA_START=830 /DNA_END=1027 /DNA_ORIENTATION=+